MTTATLHVILLLSTEATMSNEREWFYLRQWKRNRLLREQEQKKKEQKDKKEQGAVVE